MFLEQNCGAEHLQCLPPTRQAEKKGGKKKIILSRQWKIPQTPHFQPLRELVCQIQDTLVLFKHRGKASVGMTSFHPHPIFLAYSKLGETFVELKGFLVREGSILPSCVMQPIATFAGAWRVAAWPERDWPWATFCKEGSLVLPVTYSLVSDAAIKYICSISSRKKKKTSKVTSQKINSCSVISVSLCVCFLVVTVWSLGWMRCPDSLLLETFSGELLWGCCPP